MKNNSQDTLAVLWQTFKQQGTIEGQSYLKVLNCMEAFFDQVYRVVEKIPFGKTISYGEIARLLGQPRAARVVGWAMRRCPEHLPWQRVIMADGSITGGAFADLRRALLEDEGVPFLPDGRVDVKASRWLFTASWEKPGFTRQKPP